MTRALAIAYNEASLGDAIRAFDEVRTMAVQQIWTARTVLARALGQELASITYFCDDDTAGTLPNALSLQIVARIAGVQVGETTVRPLANGTVRLPLLAQIGGTLEGRIDDVRALDPSGKPVAWNAAIAVGFRITALGDVTVPIATIARFVPVLGPLLAAAFALAGNKVVLALAHEDVVVHLPRTA